MQTYIIIIIIVVILLCCCCCISSSSGAFLMSQSSSKSPSSGSSNKLPSTNTSENKTTADRPTTDRSAANKAAADNAAADKAAADKAFADKIARADKDDKTKFIDILTVNLETEKQYLNEISQNERKRGSLEGIQYCGTLQALAYLDQCITAEQLKQNISTLNQKKSELYKKFENDYKNEMKKYNLSFPELMDKNELLFEKFIRELKK
jgi:hypothetical protein